MTESLWLTCPDDASCREVARVLETDRTVEAVRLSFSPITDEGALEVVKALRKNGVVRELDFSYCKKVSLIVAWLPTSLPHLLASCTQPTMLLYL